MYGIVNKAIEDLVVHNFGLEKWEQIKDESGIEIDYFLSNEPYDDAITYQLAGAASKVLSIPVSDILIDLGEWWVIKTTKEKYGGLMEAGGSSLREFLVNLPIFHNRIMLLYPKLTPPEFKVSDVSERSIHIHYFSKREGLQEFVRGLLQGLGKLYNTPVTIEMTASRLQGADHEIYKVTW
jgi:hypothetical protein